ncbi:hypothetical protein BUL40_02340 [Croceivirga radicis]|uniref:2TM domain-containing protein n=1 Tax=Croceivirga radicis TaxID=1929488 RepID=A0A1V6LW52_9FLAO|nr:hypothetical protein [Croceivirga radicis]OQD44412.1 hypothetical protein BUL40_02340 [Croceivirga radicis]
MKTITKHLLSFALIAIIATIAFRYFLSYGIENQSTIIVTTSAIIYGISMFLAGWVFGKKDGEYLPIFDLGFRFHLTTYLTHNGISLLWILLGFGSKYEKLEWTVMVAVYWGFFLFLHFIYYLWARKNSIDNLDKEDLFE